MARIFLNENSVKQAVDTADAIMEAMEHLATRLRQAQQNGGTFPAGYALAISQLGEGLNAVNVMIKTYSAPNIDSNG